ncbi:MAG: phage protease, partial [Betaproteobacteria bacterium]
MEIRPNPSNVATAPLTAIAASDDAGTPPSAIKLLPLGEIAARDGRRWRIPDRAAAEAVLSATRAWHGATDAVIDYDHQTD